mgnify:CR=1 FL=1
MTPLSAPLANQVARSLGHAVRGWRDFGVMRQATCSRCGGYMVENVSDGKGVTGPLTETKCQK